MLQFILFNIDYVYAAGSLNSYLLSIGHVQDTSLGMHHDELLVSDTPAMLDILSSFITRHPESMYDSFALVYIVALHQEYVSGC